MLEPDFVSPGCLAGIPSPENGDLVSGSVYAPWPVSGLCGAWWYTDKEVSSSSVLVCYGVWSRGSVAMFEGDTFVM